MIDEGSDPKMRMFAIEHGGDDAEGPYTDEDLLKKTLAIIRQIEPNAEIIGRECNPWSEQILAGLLPFRIHVDLVDGMPQLPAEVSITWPPSSMEGIQIGNLEFREYFVWAESEKAALRKLATLNKAVQSYSPKHAAAEEL
jgi:hypothetical protein